MSSTDHKKHPCPDCTFCQWCSDDRCALCLRKDCCKKKLSVAEQIALYDEINRVKTADCAADETLDSLSEYGLKIIQPKSGYRFSLDPLLLSDFAPTDRNSILDLGCGCGIISLVMARKCQKAAITGVELQKEMAGIALRNCADNRLSTRVRIIESDILDLGRHLSSEGFDLVLANPPYRRQGEGKISPKPGRDLARHESSANLHDFMTIAKKMAKPGASICFICHPERMAEMLSLATGLKLSPIRLQMVHGDSTLPARMFMVEFLKGRKGTLAVLPPINIKASVYGERQQDGMKIAR